MTTNQLSVRVLFFGAARVAVGHDKLDISCPIRSTTTELFQKILSEYPALNRFGKSLLLAVNQQYADPKRELREGDELAIFPPVSGGSTGSAGILPPPSEDRDFFELTTDPIDVAAVARRVVLPQ